MSLNFNVNKIENYQENFPETENGDWNIKTWAVVHRMMHTGLGWELTPKNAAEFYARCKFMDLVSGTILIGPNGEKVGLTTEDIKGHIGLTVNISPETRNQFVKRNVAWNFADWINEYVKGV